MKVLLFGATGTAGASVLKVCLDSPRVEEVRAIARRPLRTTHRKLTAFIHSNFLDYAAVRQALTGIDVCLSCPGVSVTQVTEAEYRTITHDFTLAAARALKAASPGVAFHYISGQGTRSDSRLMWARVKAQTENELIELIDAVCWRPAAIDAEPSDNAPKLYSALRPLFRLLKPFRSLYIAGEDLGRAMLQAASENLRARIIENAAIRDLADRARQL